MENGNLLQIKGLNETKFRPKPGFFRIMKKENKIISKDSIELLAEQISKLDSQFRSYAYKQVNSSLTIRNWIIGYYIYEFEQKGKDRAEYGEKLIPNLALVILT